MRVTASAKARAQARQDAETEADFLGPLRFGSAHRGPDTRSLTDAEIEGLQQALGKPVDRDLLVRRVSQIIRDVAHLASQPKPADPRPSFGT